MVAKTEIKSFLNISDWDLNNVIAHVYWGNAVA
jgi:hypothetical protein